MKNLMLLLFILLTSFHFEAKAQRYLSEIFTEVTVERNIVYARNMTLISGAPVSQELALDFYHATEDTESNRPLVILLHTGNFLPLALNGTTSGSKEDFPLVEIATRLAKMGYAVAIANYRLGWNPISTHLDVRKSTFINAIYRGMQDLRSCVRFFRKEAIDGGNRFGICPNRLVSWGVGTGGFIATAAATVDDYQDFVVPKFIDSYGMVMIDPAIHGNPLGTSVGLISGGPMGLDTMSLPNHVGYDHEVQLAVNMGGAIADTSWIDANDPAFISFHVPDDPFIPYVEETLIQHPGELILEVQGSYLITKVANELGLNNKMKWANINDVYTNAAKVNNEGMEGLFPFIRPTWENPWIPTNPRFSEASPWHWWDFEYWATQPHFSCQLHFPDCNFDVMEKLHNRDASEEKGKTYIDSIMGYFAPRAYAQLDLWATYCATTNTEELWSADQVNLKVVPNPSAGVMVFTSKEEQVMESIELYNLAGQLIKSKVVNASQFQLNRDYLNTGMYIAKVKFANGILAQKIVFE